MTPVQQLVEASKSLIDSVSTNNLLSYQQRKAIELCGDAIPAAEDWGYRVETFIRLYTKGDSPDCQCSGCNLARELTGEG